MLIHRSTHYQDKSDRVPYAKFKRRRHFRLFARVARMAKWAYAVAHAASVVCPSINVSFQSLLLKNGGSNLDQICYGASLERGDWIMYKWRVWYGGWLAGPSRDNLQRPTPPEELNGFPPKAWSINKSRNHTVYKCINDGCVPRGWGTKWVN